MSFLSIKNSLGTSSFFNNTSPNFFFTPLYFAFTGTEKYLLSNITPEFSNGLREPFFSLLKLSDIFFIFLLNFAGVWFITSKVTGKASAKTPVVFNMSMIFSFLKEDSIFL